MEKKRVLGRLFGDLEMEEKVRCDGLQSMASLDEAWRKMVEVWRTMMTGWNDKIFDLSPFFLQLFFYKLYISRSLRIINNPLRSPPSPNSFTFIFMFEPAFCFRAFSDPAYKQSVCHQLI